MTLTWYMGAGVPDDIATAEALADAFHEENRTSPSRSTRPVPRARGGQPHQDAPRHRRDDRSALVQHRLAAAGAQPGRADARRRATSPGSTPSTPRTWTVSTGTARRSSGRNAMAAASSTTSVFDTAVSRCRRRGTSLDKTRTIKAAGEDPVIQTYGDTWTSQLLMLADFYNMYAQDPDWADKYTDNEAKFADTLARSRASRRCRSSPKAAPSTPTSIDDVRPGLREVRDRRGREVPDARLRETRSGKLPGRKHRYLRGARRLGGQTV